MSSFRVTYFVELVCVQVNGNLKYLEGHGPETETGSGEVLTEEEAEALALKLAEEEAARLKAKKP